MNYIIFDLEATCEENDKTFPNEIIEIGAVKYQEQNGELVKVGEFNAFVKPVKRPILTEFCKRLTTITQSDVDNAERFPQVIQKFKEWVGVGKEDYILCSWGHYDKGQLKTDLELHRLRSTWVEKHISLKHQHGEITNKRPMGTKKAMKYAKLSFEGTHHRGIDDARNISKVFLHFFDKWDFNK